MITNVKVSLIFSCCENWKSILKSRAQQKLFSLKEYGNMVIIRKTFVITIFEKKKTSEKTFIHVNLSGVKNIKDIGIIKENILQNIFPSYWILKNYKIDNISATFKFPCKINLKNLKQELIGSKYDVNRFPGLFYKIEQATFIIFQSGKINILGCKEENIVYSRWQDIYKILMSAPTCLNLK